MWRPKSVHQRNESSVRMHYWAITPLAVGQWPFTSRRLLTAKRDLPDNSAVQNHLAYVWVIIFFYYYISLFFKNMFKLFFRIQILLRLYLIFSTFVLNFLNHSNVILKNKFS
jgi:hypothetical protein